MIGLFVTSLVSAFIAITSNELRLWFVESKKRKEDLAREQSADNQPV